MVTTWNSGDKTANITLTGSSLIATSTSSAQAAVRATATVSGKVYLEFVLPSGSNSGVGFANATASLASALGSDLNAVILYPYAGGGSPGYFFTNNAALGAGIGLQWNGGTSVVICLAWDLPNNKIWARANGGPWNGSALNDPAAGTGSTSTASLNAGPYYPAFQSTANGQATTANFGAQPFAYVPPTGFTGIDASALTYNGSSKFIGYESLTPNQDAATSSKFIASSGLSPPQNAAVAAKVIAYTVLTPVPFYDVDWPPYQEFMPPRDDGAMDEFFAQPAIALSLFGRAALSVRAAATFAGSPLALSGVTYMQITSRLGTAAAVPLQLFGSMSMQVKGRAVSQNYFFIYGSCLIGVQGRFAKAQLHPPIFLECEIEDTIYLLGKIEEGCQ